MSTKLAWLNAGNKTSEIQVEYLDRVIKEFKKDIIALEIGSAYGGGVEMMARMLKGVGKAYGFDTFEGHPKDLADDRNSFEATCMDSWYHHTNLGKDKLSQEYQRKILDEEGLDNAILIQGRVNKDSFRDIPYANFILMDLDLIKSTETAYEGIKDKATSGAYFIMHDSIPPDHLPFINKFVYETMLKDGRWYLEKESLPGMCTVMRRK